MISYFSKKKKKIEFCFQIDQELWRNEVKQGRELFKVFYSFPFAFFYEYLSFSKDLSGILGEQISLGDLRAIFDLHMFVACCCCCYSFFFCLVFGYKQS